LKHIKCPTISINVHSIQGIEQESECNLNNVSINNGMHK
jgi:hypothetical protein